MKNTNKRAIGFRYEQIAGKYLVSQGYEIVEYNFYSRSGEIDIVAKHGDYLVFVEVKYRENAKNGHPFEAVSVSKQRAILRCAMYYLQKHGLHDVPIRFDVVGIVGGKIHLIQNAFEFTR